MPLSPAEFNYVEIVSALPSISSDFYVSRTSLDAYSKFSWLGSSKSPNPLAETFLSDESIMEAISLDEVTWNDTHNHSSFLHSLTVMSMFPDNFSS